MKGWPDEHPLCSRVICARDLLGRWRNDIVRQKTHVARQPEQCAQDRIWKRYCWGLFCRLRRRIDLACAPRLRQRELWQLISHCLSCSRLKASWIRKFRYWTWICLKPSTLPGEVPFSSWNCEGMSILHPHSPLLPVLFVHILDLRQFHMSWFCGIWKTAQKTSAVWLHNVPCILCIQTTSFCVPCTYTMIAYTLYNAYVLQKMKLACTSSIDAFAHRGKWCRWGSWDKVQRHMMYSIICTWLLEASLH